jgi:hypothetical protein
MAYYSGGGGFLCVAHCHVTHSFSVATLFYMDGQTKGMVMLTNLRGTGESEPAHEVVPASVRCNLSFRVA